MKTKKLLLVVGVSALLSQFAMAELPVNKQILAQIDTTVDFCSKQRSATAQKLKDKSKALYRKISTKDLEDARASEEYKDAHKNTENDLNKLSPTEVSKTCGVGENATK